MSTTPVKARIALRDDGPRSLTGRVRPLKRGETIVITNVADILYFHDTGHCDVTIIQGHLPEIQGPLEAEPEEEQPEDTEEEQAEGEPDDATEEQEGDTEAEPDGEGEAPEGEEGEAEPEAGAEVEEEPTEEQAEGEAEPEAYTRAKLEAMSKGALVALAEQDGLVANGQPLKLTMSMNKPAMIDAIMSAERPTQG